MIPKINIKLLFSLALGCFLFFSCSDDNVEEENVDYMEEAEIFDGPEDGGKYTEAQTSITLLYKGHSLYFGTIFVRQPHFYIANLSEKGDPVAVYECQLTSLEEGGLNGVVLDFGRSGVTQTPGEKYGTYDIVYGDFEITIPAGLVESAGCEYNPEQKIRFSQVKP